MSISEGFFGTGYNILNISKLQFCKQPLEIIQEIAVKNTSKLLHSVLLIERTSVVLCAVKNIASRNKRG